MRSREVVQCKSASDHRQGVAVLPIRLHQQNDLEWVS